MKVSTIPMDALAEVLHLQMESGGDARLIVTGDSMYPTFRHRKDVVFLTKPTRPLKKKDLILYQRESGQYVLHRIVTRPKNDAFICSGDNQWEKEPVCAGQVIALAERFIRKGRAHTARDFRYRLWVGLWVGLFPVRRPLLKLRRFLGRLRNK